MANPQGKQVEESITLHNREARTVKGILTYLKDQTGRDYKRDSVYRWYRNGDLEAVSTPVGNYYFLDSLNIEVIKSRNKPGGKPEQKTKKDYQKIPKQGYDSAIKNKALQLLKEGRSRRSIALELHVSPQTINNWAKQKHE